MRHPNEGELRKSASCSVSRVEDVRCGQAVGIQRAMGWPERSLSTGFAPRANRLRPGRPRSPRRAPGRSNSRPYLALATPDLVRIEKTGHPQPCRPAHTGSSRDPMFHLMKCTRLSMPALKVVLPSVADAGHAEVHPEADAAAAPDERDPPRRLQGVERLFPPPK